MQNQDCCAASRENDERTTLGEAKIFASEVDIFRAIFNSYLEYLPQESGVSCNAFQNLVPVFKPDSSIKQTLQPGQSPLVGLEEPYARVARNACSTSAKAEPRHRNSLALIYESARGCTDRDFRRSDARNDLSGFLALRITNKSRFSHLSPRLIPRRTISRCQQSLIRVSLNACSSGRPLIHG